ncbi:hypothetical Protein psc1_03280 [Candidatus Phytoplasma solani]|uniref:Uncharacterized protein n=1 Tax=Candidatus Phytoplasma solani TaxID=69896 RepID=A0A421NYT6_9MOLU|nr:hypothetical protein PSSA1_v1c0610 [Candidatus Phytoplasma solani]RMI89199.1 hypothetical protein PSSA1_v1c0790 [Candidatus Phytoplasma solani]
MNDFSTITQNSIKNFLTQLRKKMKKIGNLLGNIVPYNMKVIIVLSFFAPTY